MENEIWKDVKGYEGLYQVSNIGRIKAFSRTVKNGHGYRTTKEKILKQSNDSHGYCIVNLSKEAKFKSRTIHQLVAESFLNFTQNKYVLVVDHINNDHLDNRPENLQIITQRENCSKDQFRYGISSKYVGVSWDIKRQKWRSSIGINCKTKFLGRFYTEKEASDAYQKALHFL